MTDAQAESRHWNGVTENDELMWASVHGGDLRINEYLDAIDDAFTVPMPARVLDLGCGPGRLICPGADRWLDAELVGVDSSPMMVRIARKRCGSGTVRFELGDGRQIPCHNEYFDAAYSVAFFQHIPEDAVRGYLAEVARVLRLGGVFRFQYVEGDNDTFLCHDYTPRNMEHWCAIVGLAVQQVEKGRLEDNWVWVTAQRRART